MHKHIGTMTFIMEVKVIMNFFIEKYLQNVEDNDDDDNNEKKKVINNSSYEKVLLQSEIIYKL